MSAQRQHAVELVWPATTWWSSWTASSTSSEATASSSSSCCKKKKNQTLVSWGEPSERTGQYVTLSSCNSCSASTHSNSSALQWSRFHVLKHWRVLQHIGDNEESNLWSANVNLFQLRHSAISGCHSDFFELYIHIIFGYRMVIERGQREKCSKLAWISHAKEYERVWLASIRWFCQSVNAK